jgi:hypothetical protein
LPAASSECKLESGSVHRVGFFDGQQAQGRPNRHPLLHVLGRARQQTEPKHQFGDDGSRQEEAFARSQTSMNPTADTMANRNQCARMVRVKKVVSHRS